MKFGQKSTLLIKKLADNYVSLNFKIYNICLFLKAQRLGVTHSAKPVSLLRIELKNTVLSIGFDWEFVHCIVHANDESF